MDRVINLLNQLALAAMRRSEIVGAFVVIAIVFMMILPLPTWLVDTLIGINMTISAILLMVAMYLPSPLAFSSFPSVLLVTTLFRLGISIATTRLILLQGDAGHIILTFGNFVVGGNLVVGLVVFLILTIVQFVVITKGAERVAEVAARFSLDAMPGKQMSIDGDMRAGTIDMDEAKRRRNIVEKESQLYGAMDGAMKFVKGDAIAGLIIVAVNLLGGIVIGTMQRGMTAGDAAKTYSVLTIGDGLIAQIPALFIAICAGMIVTRVPDEDRAEANIGRQIAEQITSQPKAWIIAAVAMLGFAALPGMPTAVFIVIAIICGCGGLLQLQRAKPKAEQAQAAAVAPEMNGREDLRTFSPSRQFVLQFHPSQNPAQIEALVSEIRQRRNRLVVQYGLTLPSFIIEQAEHLPPDEFRFSVYEVPLLKATFTQSHVAVDARALDGIARQRGLRQHRAPGGPVGMAAGGRP
jgi:type III secretion protein V